MTKARRQSRHENFKMTDAVEKSGFFAYRYGLPTEMRPQLILKPS
jgi:hypothetical protein